MTLEQHRLRWKCRRGLLELDLVLQKTIEAGINEKAIPLLNELLDLPDNDLLDIVMGRSDDYGLHLNHLVARLRAA